MDKRLPPREIIRLEVPRDVMYWAGLWGLSDQELRDAVAAVGPLATDVAIYIGQPLKGQDLRPRLATKVAPPDDA